MNHLRTLAAMTLAAAVTVAASAREARAAKVAGHFEPGLLVANGFEAIDKKPTFGGDVTTWWSPLRHLDLGVESGMAVTSFLYGWSDGEPVVGGRGYDSPDLHESLTLLPRALLGSRVRLPGDTSIALLAGTTQIVSGAMGGHSIFPFPTGAVEIETRFGSNERYGVRAGVSYMRWVYGDARSFTMSTLAFTWGT